MSGCRPILWEYAWFEFTPGVGKNREIRYSNGKVQTGIGSDPKDMAKQLGELGAAGWELVSVSAMGGFSMFFKRPATQA